MTNDAQPDHSYGTLTYTDRDGRPQTHTLARGRTIIGRGSEAGLRLNAPEVAEAHAAIVCTPNGCYLIDLGTPNPTQLRPGRRFANDAEPPRTVLQPQQSRLLHDTDLITVGRFELRYNRRLSSGSIRPPPEVAAQHWRPPSRAPRREKLHWSFVIQPRSPGQRDGLRHRSRPAAHWKLPHASRQKATRRHLYRKKVAQSGPPPSAYLRYLPPLFQDDEVVNTFLLAFEAILGPIEATVDQIDAYLHPALAPAGLLPWLATWVDVALPVGWTEARQRAVIAGAARCYARRGTRQGLEMLLRLFMDEQGVVVDDQAPDLPNSTFRVTAPKRLEAEEEVLRLLIEREKPAQTYYELRFTTS